jgi:RNA-directed DNA polymerase
VVPTPLVGPEPESKIEDFFDQATKQTQIDGKNFDPANEFDTTVSYGKKVFAYKVIRPNASSINFTGFRPLLSSLNTVITLHSAGAHSPNGPTPTQAPPLPGSPTATA